jgi:hypothetical protein
MRSISKVRVAIAVLAFVMCAVCVGSSSLRARQLTTAQIKEQVKAGKLCTLPEDVAYSRGAYVKYQNVRYRCVAVYGENMKPAGLGWVEADSTAPSGLR